MMMGWLSYHRPKGETDRAHFERELLSSTDCEIVRCASKNRVFYAAVRTASTGEVWALVVLMRWARGRFNFAYKDMHESTGPNAADAPAAVLDALTPTNNAYALEWRERCRTNLAHRSAIRDKLRGVIVDAVIRTTEPLRFENGLQARQFRCVHRAGRTIAWQAITDDGARFLCNLGSQWAERHGWEIITPATAAGSGPAAPSTRRAKPDSHDEEALLVSGQETG